MILKTLWIQRKCSYEGEFAPECLVTVDEYCYDENSTWFDQKVEQELKDNESDIDSYKIIDIVVEQDHIVKLLNKNAVIKGEINNE